MNKFQVLKYSFVVLISIMCSMQDAKAQSVLFTQYEQAPLFINPGLTGNFDGKQRIFTNFRSQWFGILQEDSFVTGMASFDMARPLGKHNVFGLGVYAIGDISGTNYSRNQFDLLVSFRHYITKTETTSNTLSFGSGVGLTNRNSLMISETKANFTSGIVWDYKRSANHMQLGASIFHDDQTVSYGSRTKPFILNIHGRYEFPVGKTTLLAPHFLVNRVDLKNYLILGASLKVKTEPLNPDAYFQFDLIRKQTVSDINGGNLNAYAAIFSYQRDQIRLGVSYDYYQNVDSNGIEISFGYTMKGKVEKEE